MGPAGPIGRAEWFEFGCGAASYGGGRVLGEREGDGGDGLTWDGGAYRAAHQEHQKL